MNVTPIQPSDTEVDEVEEQISPEESQPRRGRGRVKKERDPFPSQFPIPQHSHFLNPAEFFDYLPTVPEDKRTRGMLFFYRYEPVRIPTNPDYFRKIPLESFPFAAMKKSGWEHTIMNMFGSGKYGCYLKESAQPPETGNRNVCHCWDILTRTDWANFPPLMDPSEVDLSAPENATYVAWLRSRGQIKTAEDQQGESDMVVTQVLEQNRELIGELVRKNTPTPPPPYRETAGEKLTGDAARAAIEMVKEQAKSGTKDEGLSGLKGVVEVVQALRGGDDGTRAMIEGMNRRLEAAETRANTLMDRIITMTTTVQNPATAPKSFMEQLREAKEMVEFFRPERDSGGGGAPALDGGSDIKALVVQNLPGIIAGASGLVQQLVNGGIQIASAYSGKPLPEPPKPNPQQQVQQQQQLPPVSVPAGLTEDVVRRYHHAFGVFGAPMIEHLKRGDNGVDFGQFIISGYGSIAYKSFCAIARDAEGKINTEPFIAVVQTYAPLWSNVAGMEQEFRKFVAEMVSLQDLIAAQEAAENQEEGE